MHKIFDRQKLDIKSLADRRHDLDVSVVKSLNASARSKINKNFKIVAGRIVSARRKRASVILMIGGHVIRSGVQRHLIDLMERGYISCIAMNGACMIHDFEFALIGATTESVSRYIKSGQFGLWQETGRINDCINESRKKGLGMGESVGRFIFEGDFKYKNISLLAAAYRLKIPATVHVGIGYDIIHEHPNCDGAALGAASYRDFLYFAKIVQNLEHGVVMNFGSAVMAPEVFLKALSMARNIAYQEGRSIKHFTALVCDLLDLPEKIKKEPSRYEPNYYYRPWKTMLIRTVAGGGESFYVKGHHGKTIPSLWASINTLEAKIGKSN